MLAPKIVERCTNIDTYICFSIYLHLVGSLPPSPADSGVSDVDSSSSGGQPCSEELKARLGLQPHVAPQTVPGPFLNPNYYHNPTQLRNIWNNRNVQCEYNSNNNILTAIIFNR